MGVLQNRNVREGLTSRKQIPVFLLSTNLLAGQAVQLMLAERPIHVNLGKSKSAEHALNFLGLRLLLPMSTSRKFVPARTIRPSPNSLTFQNEAQRNGNHVGDR